MHQPTRIERLAAATTNVRATLAARVFDDEHSAPRPMSLAGMTHSPGFGWHAMDTHSKPWVSSPDPQYGTVPALRSTPSVRS